MIVDGENQVLIGGKSDLNMRLVKTVNNVTKNLHNYEKELFIKKYSDIFEGSGQFRAKY